MTRLNLSGSWTVDRSPAMARDIVKIHLAGFQSWLRVLGAELDSPVPHSVRQSPVTCYAGCRWPTSRSTGANAQVVAS